MGRTVEPDPSTRRIVMRLWDESEYRCRFHAARGHDDDSAKLNVIAFSESPGILSLDDLPAPASVKVDVIWRWIQEHEGGESSATS